MAKHTFHIRNLIWYQSGSIIDLCHAKPECGTRDPLNLIPEEKFQACGQFVEYGKSPTCVLIRELKRRLVS